MDEKPWMNEPDREEFQHEGFDCLLNRNPLGAWCGYVAVNRGHPAYEKSPFEDKILDDVEVHGGLTYSDKCQGEICHIAKNGQDHDVWWLGFDCAHYTDFSPWDKIRDPEYKNDAKDFLFYTTPTCGSTYKDIHYARAETMGLAEQLRKMAA